MTRRSQRNGHGPALIIRRRQLRVFRSHRNFAGQLRRAISLCTFAAKGAHRAQGRLALPVRQGWKKENMEGASGPRRAIADCVSVRRHPPRNEPRCARHQAGRYPNRARPQARTASAKESGSFGTLRKKWRGRATGNARHTVEVREVWVWRSARRTLCNPVAACQAIRLRLSANCSARLHFVSFAATGACKFNGSLHRALVHALRSPALRAGAKRVRHPCSG